MTILKYYKSTISHKNKDRSYLHCLISFFNDSHHALTGVEKAAVTSFSVSLRTPNTLVTLRPNSAQAPSEYTHKASRTTTVTDIRDASLNHSAPAQSESLDRTWAPHKGQSWHGDARPLSPTSCCIGSKGGWGPPLNWTEHNLSQLIWTKLGFVNIV